MLNNSQSDDPLPLNLKKSKFDPNVISLFYDTIPFIAPILDEVAEKLRLTTEEDDYYEELMSQYKYNLDRYIFSNYKVS